MHFLVLALWFSSSLKAQSPPKVIVLSFEGWRAEQARQAAISGLASAFNVLSEEEVLSAAARIAADVGTPEGMARVVRHLQVELVLGGSVEGRGQRSTTRLFVVDSYGNELAKREAPGPGGRGAEEAIGRAALEACRAAWDALHPPLPPSQPAPSTKSATSPRSQPEASTKLSGETTRPMRSLEEIENERPWDSDKKKRDEEGAKRGQWKQPFLRGFIELAIRNRAALVRPLAERVPSPENVANFFPQLGLLFEARPLANAKDALRGLYARASTWFSIGMSYYTVSGEVQPLQVFGIEGLLGYAGGVEETIEIIGATGFGYDTYSLTLPEMIDESDFPSTAYPYLPIYLQGRVRLLPLENPDADLHIEMGGGARIAFGGGELAGNSETTPYFAERQNPSCPNRLCNGDFGKVFGVAFHGFAGLGIIISPGLSGAFRLSYTRYFLSFSEGSGTRAASSGHDEATRFEFLAGWSLR